MDKNEINSLTVFKGYTHIVNLILFFLEFNRFKWILTNSGKKSLKTFSAVFFTNPIVQVFRSLKPQGLRVRFPTGVVSFFLNFPFLKFN